jgi:hypothetical protein
MRFVCPHCFRDYTAPDTAAGCAMTCTACSKGFTIPQLGTPTVVTYAADPPLQPPNGAKPTQGASEEKRRRQQREEEEYLAEMELRQFRRKKNRRAKWSLLLKLWLLLMLGVATATAVYFTWQKKQAIDEQIKTKERR